MTTRRRCLFLALPSVAAVLVGGCWLVWQPESAIAPENAVRIRLGMTRVEVAEILRGPPRNDTTGAPLEGVEGGLGALGALFSGPEVWESDHVCIFVSFDEDDLVRGVFWCPFRRVHESPLDVLRRWLHL
jgi:hypothetical protein